MDVAVIAPDDLDEAYAGGLTLSECTALEQQARAEGYSLTVEHLPMADPLSQRLIRASLSGPCILSVVRPTIFEALVGVLGLWAPWARPRR